MHGTFAMQERLTPHGTKYGQDITREKRDGTLYRRRFPPRQSYLAALSACQRAIYDG
jgi:hypothetical protein